MDKDLTVKNSEVVLNNNVYSESGFSHMLKVSEVFANSQMIPEKYQNHFSNCFVAVQMSSELGISPLQFMQHSYFTKGKTGIESKLAIGLANKSGLLENNIEFEIKGTGLKMACTASAVLKKNGKRIHFTVPMQMAVDEGWYHERKDKNKNYYSKWKTMQEVMISYRSAMFLIRINMPQVIIGLQSKEELIDVYGEPKVKNITPEKEDLSKLEITEPTMKTLEIEDPPKEKAMGIAEYFERRGIAKEYLEKHINKDYDHFDEEDVEILRNVYTSIKEGQMSVEDFKEMNK